MAVGSVSDKQTNSMIDLMLNKDVQTKQAANSEARQAQAAAKQQEEKKASTDSVGSEGVKVSLTNRNTNETGKAQADNTRTEKQETLNAQAQRAIQAYQNANMTAESGPQKPEAEKQMKRIAGT
ncbi:MAG: hypothetical protein EPN22_05830 [Nitrospirae bacterium]|nr:MAG: hypothetical protein EPN22_05830 [Nitrospirota bacterium]